MRRLIAALIALTMFAAALGVHVCAEELLYQTFSFTVGTEEETPYLKVKGAWNGKNTRYADAQGQIIYTYNLAHIDNVRSLELSGIIWQQLHLSVSTDGANYTTVYQYKTTDPSDHGLPQAKRTFLLTDLVDLNSCTTLYVRIADAYPDAGGWGGAVRNNEPMTLKVGYFEDPTIGFEIHSFDITSEQEKNYLIKEGSLNVENVRYVDGANEFIYRYSIRNTLNVQKIEFSAVMGQQLHLSVSTDGENYTTVYCYESDDPDDRGLPRSKRTYDLLGFVDIDQCKTLYVRIADAYTQNGWGGAIAATEPVSLKVTYIKPTIAQLNAAEMTPTEHCMPVFGCNSEWGGGYVLDTTDQNAGYAALSLTLRAGDTLGQTMLEQPVDARGMDTLEFDLYVSDTAVFDLPFSGYLTLSSAGSKDAAAVRWSIRALFAAIEQKQSGWNHVVLPISSASIVNGGGGSFNIGAINHISLGWTDMTAVPAKLEWKVDSFCLTDLQKVKRDEIVAANHWLIEQIYTLEELIAQDVDEHTFKTIARLTTNSRYEIDHLTQDERSILGEFGLIAVLGEAEELVAAYEEQIATQTPVDDAIIVPEPEPEQPDEREPEQPDDPAVEPKPGDQKDAGIALWIGAAALILVIAAVVVALTLRKKKK